ncbi:flagellar motor protein MotB [Romboutsia sp. 1001216sp1]|uniref:flagellar motor protein MotB n=1 Tax=Romboutsia sp. 1001216sp1 TaxID=2986997 RepID=UPI00232D4514|nr:flagellar motor protein MotB [Romboutsia sp. 1001216sp1]MDB8804445.1 flagellar motor protein MotB [Romboutsia sp. 1001216sp1]MDB8806631.1 flagellar motor protein MotB [Romboutsia sp. 1001216sp1]MDB8810093.1 flagellar motor protein MotB [Romboutsia sp. 1001216sp1]MDB8815840.1 flagellar motor protein MotB [Romboutsia sp. 1001216sp1]MDB8818290.1 flagellar motor protein MotB [Romboutsia sp. 1001216sp1]
MQKRNRFEEEEEHENHERWLLSYADFITLLMIFFIIMYAMSSINKGKYEKLTTALNEAMGDGAAIADTGSNMGGETGNGLSENEKLEKVKEKLDKYLKENNLSGSVNTTIEKRGLVVSFNDSLFFNSGKADVKPDQVNKLVKISEIINKSLVKDSYIRVEGYTDNVPMHNEIFKSNWDLSVMRASNVAQILINNGGINPQKISAIGYSEYRPKSDNNTVEGKAKNRRVDILILNSKFNEVENNKK